MEERRGQRRRATDEDIERRLSGLEDRMHGVEQGFMKLSIGQETNNKQTAEMYALFDMGRAFFKVIGFFGRCIDWTWAKMKPLLWMAMLVSAIFYYIKGGEFRWPTWP